MAKREAASSMSIDRLARHLGPMQKTNARNNNQTDDEEGGKHKQPRPSSLSTMRSNDQLSRHAGPKPKTKTEFTNQKSYDSGRKIITEGPHTSRFQPHNYNNYARNRDHTSRGLSDRTSSCTGNFRSPFPRSNNRRDHPLKRIGLEKLVQGCEEKLVLILANSENRFEDLIKSDDLKLDEFKLILEMLAKVCSSEFDANKLMVISLACQPEFLRRFNTFLIEGASNGEDLSNMLSSMNDFFEAAKTLLQYTTGDKLKADISVLYTCANVMVQQGNISLDPEVLQRLKSINDDLQSIHEGSAKKVDFKRERMKEQMHYMDPPTEDFREISVFPSSQEILSNHRPKLWSNIVQGPYFDVQHYLGVQFRLLREDYMRPLREGIADYLQNTSTRKCDAPSVRIYKDVKFIEYIIEKSEKKGQRPREGMLLSFKVHGKKPIDWQHSKRFMHGALLCFTRNNFDTVLFATVCERDEKYLSQGQLLVTFCDQYDENVYGGLYTMVESEVYFEPYCQVLKRLKLFDESSFPMVDYIIHMKNTDKPPTYLLKNKEEQKEAGKNRDDDEDNGKVILDGDIAKYRIRHATTAREFVVNILDKPTWPSAEALGLDESQHSALHTALTNELVVIQGPPGTGKTFMALKIAETLIKNQYTTNCSSTPPILVVCLTNHALDQFLVGITQFTNEIVRIGGQSKCEDMDKYNLRNLRRNTMKESSSLFYNIYSELMITEDELLGIKSQSQCINLKNGLINICLLHDVMGRNVYMELNGKYFEWILGKSAYILTNQMDSTPYNDEPYLFKTMLQRLEEYHDNSMIEITAISDNDMRVYYEHQLQDMCNFCWQFINNVQSQLDNQPPSDEEASQMITKGLWKLSYPKRIQLYIYWVQQLNIKYQQLARGYENSILKLHDRIEEIRLHDDLQVLRGSKVVGMTTNGAARLHQLLKLLKCKIVIVEEAAEVMETHVVACLNEHCEHLILIGDHKQLRPNIAVYALGKHYNFDVSLFERFVNNRGQCETLGVQHRMAPEMAKLIVPTIYPVLKDDHSVLNRPIVSGIKHRLFFVSHTEPEQHDTEISSRRNEYEAHFLLALCKHLVMQGFREDQITILATYKGQMFFMKRIQRSGLHETIKNVHITVVDNFQGEENEIILLSLVRSNSEGRIGFLATENRICVALSRARQGLYIMGNMTILSQASETWKAVHSSLQNLGAIGTALPLKCQVHPEQECDVATVDDFQQYSPRGGCTKTCSFTLRCGHTCDQICHSLNQEHSKVLCPEKNLCTRPCDAGLHLCQKKCRDDCGPCLIIVEKALACGHSHSMRCSMEPEDFQCDVTVEKVFTPCNHKENVKCCITNCPLPCDIRLNCGHGCAKKCHPENDPDHLQYKCKKECTKLSKRCKSDHPCKKKCFEECTECAMDVIKKLPCGHELDMKCTEEPAEVQCRKKCKKILNCGHWCKRECFETCVPCQENVDKEIEACGHVVKINCYTDPTREDCREKCIRALECGHPCTKMCAESCNAKCKVVVDTVTGLCGHEDVPLLCWEKSEGVPPNVDNCKNKCKIVLECGHECTGSCKKCKQGRVHVQCQKTCNKMLVCGHRCSSICGLPCNPCNQPCKNSCRHWKCISNCSTNCNYCKKNCDWSCEHHKCTKNCGSSCNRPPCNEPCKKKLQKCEHFCSGLCGEVCPSLCWICDKDQLTKEALVQGSNETLENPKFVVLLDCDHTVEVKGLEKWFAWQAALITILSCPCCDTPVTKSKRYKTMINETYKNLSKIKQNLFPNQDQVNKKCNDLKLQLVNMKSAPGFDELDYDIDQLYDKLKVLSDSKTFSILAVKNVESLGILTNFVDNLNTVLRNIHTVRQETLDQMNRLTQFITKVAEEKSNRFGMQAAKDLSLEFVRLHHLVHGLDILKKHLPSHETQELEFIKHVCHPRRYAVQVQELSLNMLKNWGVTEEVPKFDLGIKIPKQPLKYYWFICNNGHINGIETLQNTDDESFLEKHSCNKCKFKLIDVEKPIFSKCDAKPLTSAQMNETHKEANKTDEKSKLGEQKNEHNQEVGTSKFGFQQNRNWRRLENADQQASNRGNSDQFGFGGGRHDEGRDGRGPAGYVGGGRGRGGHEGGRGGYDGGGRGRGGHNGGGRGQKWGKNNRRGKRN